MACGRDIDPEKFSKFALETYNHFVKQYPWFKMPSSVHKILLHGADVIKNNIMAIGKLTEEASEARNKDFRRYREHNTRKHSRVESNRDLLNALLVSSDPLLSNMRPTTKKDHLQLSDDARSLLVNDDFNNIGAFNDPDE